MLPWNFRLFHNLIFFSVFLVLSLYPASGILQDAPVYLTPPGFRSVKEPAIVIPAINQYPNEPPAKPVYRNASGKLLKGWAMKYVNTRRFSSDRSAWIYYRISDLADSVTVKSSWDSLPLRIWPNGTTIIFESYQGNATTKNSERLIEIVVMHKKRNTESALADSFYSAIWSYARFTPKEEFSMTPQKVSECHQCHSIAFHLTGDLVFTQFP